MNIRRPSGMLDSSTFALDETEDKYKLPEPPDEIIDAAIMAAYQDSLENPPTPEEEGRFQIGLRKLIDMFSKPSDDNNSMSRAQF